MQPTLDLDKHLKKKDYTVGKEINQRVEDYKNGILETNDFNDGLDIIRKNILSKICSTDIKNIK